MINKTSSIFWYPGHELLIDDIVRAENCYLYDSEGKRYVDLESGVWCTSVGHNHPRIIKFLTEQANQISHNGFNYTSPIVEEAAYEILSLMGFDGGKCVFLCSGSEAVEYGVRVAQSLIDRPLMMTMTDSYFGAYGSAAGKAETEWFLFDWTQCANCPDTDSCDKNCEYWAKIPFDRIGGFLIEPGSSSGLVRFPPDKLIHAIVKEVRQYDGFILANEVTTGVGRTGKWFGFQHYDISPGIIALGKGIGNGYPVSITGFSPRVIERLGDKPVKYAQSHQNDPLGAAVALEVVRIIREEGLIERCNDVAEKLVDGLDKIKKSSASIKEIRSRGLMVGLEIIDSLGNMLTVNLHKQLISNGFLTGRRPGTNVLRIDPSLTIEEKDIESFLKMLEQII